MSSDFFFTIGKTHKICQDYARVGETNQGDSFVILSDGCSSSLDTDFGARLLTLCTDNILKQGSFEEAFFEEILCNAERILGRLISKEALDATLLVAREMNDGIQVMVIGDGVVAAQQKNGSLEIIDINYGNTPAYLSYLLSEERWESYINKNWNNRIVTEYKQQTGWELQQEKSQVTKTSLIWTRFFPSLDYDAVFIFSDGVHSFQRDNGISWEAIPMIEVVQHLTAIKSTTGAFVTRRVQTFKNIFCRNNSWIHTDDLAVAAIWNSR